MKLKLEINNLSGPKFRKEFFEKIFEKTLEKSGLLFLGKKTITLSLALISSGEMKKLNRRFQGIDSPTDVLSFSEYKNQKSLRKVGDKEIFLGEIVLCYNKIKEYSKIDGKDAKNSLAEAAAHGLLHLLGFRHGKKMFQAQKENL